MTMRVRAGMTGDEPPERPDGWSLPAFVVLVLAVVAVIAIAFSAAHTVASIGECLLIVAGETAVIVLALRARGSVSLGVRAFLLGLAMGLGFFAILPLGAFGDRVIAICLCWHIAVAAWLVAFALARAVLGGAPKYL
jgi:hypothetical protein